MLHRLYQNPVLERLALQKYVDMLMNLCALLMSRSALAKCFVTPEIMRWPHMEALYGPHLRETDVFKSDKRWEDLHTRIIEHVSTLTILAAAKLIYTSSEYSHHCSILHPHPTASPHHTS